MIIKTSPTRAAWPGPTWTMWWLVWWVVLWGIAIATSAFDYEARDLLYLAALYGMLAAVVVSLLDVAGKYGRSLLASAALVAAAVLVWHIHEQTLLPHGKLPLVVATGVLAPLLYAIHRSVGTRDHKIAASLTLLVSVAGLIAVTSIGYHSSPTIRWHLLRHNKLIGTPAYYLLDRSFAAVKQSVIDSYPQPPVDLPTGPTTHEPASETIPNIVFILIDTLRADSLAAYGDEQNLMPNLNEFGGNAISFLDVWANASWTKPSLASMMTGLLPEEHGALEKSDALAEEHVTLAESLKAAGYSTMAVVAHPSIGPSTRFDQGFDYYENVESAETIYARADEINAAVREQLGTASIRQPLFLYVHYLDPHLPYLSGGRESVWPGVSRHGYEQELAYLDRELDDLLSYLHEQLGNSVILITSDHGEEFREHDGDYLPHGHTLYQELVHIPAILKTPWSEEPGVVTARLEARDFHDLLISMSGGTRPDVRAWAAGQDKVTRYTAAFISSGFPLDRPYLRNVFMRAVQHEDHVLIWSAYGDTLELYDLSTDPAQTRNLVRRSPVLRDDLLNRMNAQVGYWYGQRAVILSQKELEKLRGLGYVQ